MDENELGESLQHFVKTMTRGHVLFEATVTQVDMEAFTCDCLNNDGVTNIYSVPLKVLVGSQASVIEIPVVGSNIIMCFRDGNIQRPQILFIDQVDQLLINCKTKVQFNAGQLGGMVKVEPLTSALNAGQDDQNNLKQLISSWTPVPNDGGASLKALLASWYGQKLTVTDQSSIEDTTIIH